jgi:KaiC/GvpD/RAD55 family RecA-like ATPase
MLANLGLGNIPVNTVLLVEEDMGNIKSIFVQMATQELLGDMKKIVYLSTSSLNEEIKGNTLLITENNRINAFILVEYFYDLNSLMCLCQKAEAACNSDSDILSEPALREILDADICIIDTFSYLFMDEDICVIKNALSSFAAMSRDNNTTFLLLSDMGILSDRSEKIIRAIVDGIIQFRTEYMGSKINRYINIPKMPGNPPLNRMIPFNVTGKGITIDTRERVG